MDLFNQLSIKRKVVVYCNEMIKNIRILKKMGIYIYIQLLYVKEIFLNHNVSRVLVDAVAKSSNPRKPFDDAMGGF